MNKNLKINKTSEQYVEFIKRFNKAKIKNSPLMEVLQISQECFSCIPLEIQEYISEELNIPMTQIYGVITFYTRFTLSPKAEYHIYVCTGTACYIKDANLIITKLEELLKVKKGTPTKDGKFFIDTSRCVGCCGNAPVIIVNDKMHGNIKLGDLENILNSYKNNKD